jgi:hypothetical protein
VNRQENNFMNTGPAACPQREIQIHVIANSGSRDKPKRDIKLKRRKTVHFHNPQTLRERSRARINVRFF